LVYVSSWVDDKFERCYQLMETLDHRLLDAWMANWSDLIDCDICSDGVPAGRKSATISLCPAW
jgi:hypothetical protein